MIQESLTIANEVGLDPRNSAKLTRLASGFVSEVWLSRSGRKVNAKVVMDVAMLAAGMGTTLELSVSGGDERECVGAIRKLIEDKFGDPL
ncbi:HPr family phosphocarrier protein [Pseudomonas neuropathica]|jgi:phosphocarrier protein|uniref:HPr family phosphocarrier protein n=1 Tax=Pseudomonas neuropathica TaxID=2730425 RepID=UPI0034D4DC88